MELTDKAFKQKTFAIAKQAHDDAVTKGAKCGPDCGMFHTVPHAKAVGFLLGLGTSARLIP